MSCHTFFILLLYRLDIGLDKIRIGIASFDEDVNNVVLPLTGSVDYQAVSDAIAAQTRATVNSKYDLLVGLDFKGPVSIIKVMSSWSVYLTAPLLGKLTLKPLNQYSAHVFARSWLLESVERRE